MGISALPPCPPNSSPFSPCRLMHLSLVRSSIYSSWAQQNVVPAQYFRDPERIDEYLAANEFLKDINNEREGDRQVEDGGNSVAAIGDIEPRKQTYKENLSSLNRLIMFRFRSADSASCSARFRTLTHLPPQQRADCRPAALVALHRPLSRRLELPAPTSSSRPVLLPDPASLLRPAALRRGIHRLAHARQARCGGARCVRGHAHGDRRRVLAEDHEVVRRARLEGRRGGASFVAHIMYSPCASQGWFEHKMACDESYEELSLRATQMQALWCAEYCAAIRLSISLCLPTRSVRKKHAAPHLSNRCPTREFP